METSIVKNDEFSSKNQHQDIFLRDRSYLRINSVKDVVSFDEKGVILETGLGMLSVDGADLKVKRLSLDDGEIEIEGRIDGAVFFEAREKAAVKGLFGRRKS